MHCKSKPKFCQKSGSSRSQNDAPLSDIKVEPSTIGEGSGRVLFYLTNKEKGTTIDLETAVILIYFSPSSFNFVEHHKIDNAYNYVDEYD